MPFDFSAVSAPFRMQPGLRRLAASSKQLTPTRPGARALREKLAVLFSFSQQALLSRPDFDAAPALNALCAHSASEHPDAVTWDGAERLHARHLGWSVQGHELRGDGPPEIGACLAALPTAWRLTGLLCLAFEEDFAVIDGRTACIPWLSVCLPSHWAPEDKVGRHFAEVHEPVADNQLLINASAHLARLVSGSERWERFVWTITRQPRLHTHPQRCDPTPWAAEGGPDAIARQAFFRTERQTFIPLPGENQALFTIHVEVSPLPVAVDTAATARLLHDALASMSPAVLRYRDLQTVQGPLLAWLSAAMAPPSGP